MGNGNPFDGALCAVFGFRDEFHDLGSVCQQGAKSALWPFPEDR